MTDTTAPRLLGGVPRDGVLVAVALAAGLAAGFSADAAGMRVLALAAAVLICAALVLRRDWMAPTLMLVGASVPSGYPFELAFRIPLRFVTVGLVEALLAVALVAAVVLPERSEQARRYRLRVDARIALLCVGFTVMVAVLVGFAHDNSPLDIIRDLRPLLLYSAILLPLLPNRRVHLARLCGMLVLGLTLISLLQIACVFVPSLYQFFLADRGRVWFGNGALYPLSVPIAIALAMRSAGHRRFVYMWGGCSLVMLVGLTLSQSRSQWLGTALSVAAFGVLVAVGRVRTQDVRRIVLAAAGVAIVMGVAAYVIGGPGLTSALVARSSARLQTLAEVSSDSSFMTRSINLRSANAVFLEHPLLGAGLGSTFVLRGGSGFVYTRSATYVDNVPQTLLAKFGLLGAAAFVWLWLLIARCAWGMRRTLIGAALAASIPGLAVLCLFSSYLLTGSQIIAIALLAGVLLRTVVRPADEGALRVI